MDDVTNGATGVNAAWNSGFDGTGVGVAVIDSGINDNHPDLRNANGTSRVVYHQDFTGTPTSNSWGGKWDLYGHGTHVAGIIGGNGTLSGGQYTGVAPSVTLIDLRALDANGAGSDSTVIAAIQQAIALKNTYNIRVINLSLGQAFRLAIHRILSARQLKRHGKVDRSGSGSRQLWPLERVWQQWFRNGYRSGQRSIRSHRRSEQERWVVLCFGRKGSQL